MPLHTCNFRAKQQNWLNPIAPIEV